MAGCLGRQVSPPPPPRAMGCNWNRPDINTTTVGGRGGTGGLCTPVVIAPSRRARRGGGGWEMDIRDPPWAQANFPPPLCKRPNFKATFLAFLTPKRGR